MYLLLCGRHMECAYYFAFTLNNSACEELMSHGIACKCELDSISLVRFRISISDFTGKSLSRSRIPDHTMTTWVIPFNRNAANRCSGSKLTHSSNTDRSNGPLVMHGQSRSKSSLSPTSNNLDRRFKCWSFRSIRFNTAT